MNCDWGRVGVHVLLDFADDLRVEGSLKLEPFPDGQEFLAGGVLMVVENGCAFVEDPRGKKCADELEGFVGSLVETSGSFATLA